MTVVTVFQKLRHHRTNFCALIKILLKVCVRVHNIREVS